jgi:Phage integrase, N-terminal SAM-like domain
MTTEYHLVVETARAVPVGSSAVLNETAARSGRFGAQGRSRSCILRVMKNIHLNPTPLRQELIEYLTLNRKAERTVHCYVRFIHSLAKHCHRSPDRLGAEDIQHWLYHLIAERKQAPSTINLAIERFPEVPWGCHRGLDTLPSNNTVGFSPVNALARWKEATVSTVSRSWSKSARVNC